MHAFDVRARDGAGNADPTPASAFFEVDATPPEALIVHPAFGEAVSDSITVEGTATDPRFKEYSLEVRPLGGEIWGLLAESTSPLTEGALGGWNTEAVPDGIFEIRLSVTDTLGLTGRTLVRVEVDNEAPWAWETSPAVVSGSSGGHVYTTNREVHLYFPPRAWDSDAIVSILPAQEGCVPDTLPGGAELMLSGYDISWQGAALRKSGTLEMALDAERGRGGPVGLYVLPEGEEWERLGGTVSSDGTSISSAIDSESTYAVFSDSGVGTGGGLSELSFTPRVFSPSGTFANDEVAISFNLGRSGSVTVKIYNRAGRLVEEVASAQEMNAGANVVRWNGRDAHGSQVPDGLYLVAVEALGEKKTETLAVVR